MVSAVGYYLSIFRGLLREDGPPNSSPCREPSDECPCALIVQRSPKKHFHVPHCPLGRSWPGIGKEPNEFLPTEDALGKILFLWPSTGPRLRRSGRFARLSREPTKYCE